MVSGRARGGGGETGWRRGGWWRRRGRGWGRGAVWKGGRGGTSGRGGGLRRGWRRGGVRWAWKSDWRRRRRWILEVSGPELGRGGRGGGGELILAGRVKVTLFYRGEMLMMRREAFECWVGAVPTRGSGQGRLDRGEHIPTQSWQHQDTRCHTNRQRCPDTSLDSMRRIQFLLAGRG